MAWFLGGSQLHQEEISRLLSPSGQIEAVVTEADAGATTSNSYWVHVLSRGEKKMGQPAVVLSGAQRNEKENGVHVHWVAPNTLQIEYFKAKNVIVHAQMVTVGSNTVQIQLRSGVSHSAVFEAVLVQQASRVF